jgi:sugar phosphate isomerase/epimerase
MRLTVQGREVHLSYCTNIHAGEEWEEVSASLDQYVPPIRDRLGRRPFGIGLRLSARAAQALDTPAAMAAFKAQLARLDAYVFTINAFPYGPFHGTRVKQQVYLPDWRAPERLDYTVRTARILAQLLPDGVAGSVSTVPGAFRGAGLAPADHALIATQLVHMAAALCAIERESGKCIALALEPEPGCMLETVVDTLAWFGAGLFDAKACGLMATLTGVGRGQAEALLRRHLGVCYDICHAAVAFEDPVLGLHRLAAAGIGVQKIQLSSALRIARMGASLLDLTSALDAGVYLHQVVVRGAGGMQRFDDLPEALCAFRRGEAQGEWRIHCHVPVFLAGYEHFGSTREQLCAVLHALPSMAHMPHLEVETYTWDVLPSGLRAGGKADAIARELAFIIKELAP